MSGAPLRSPCFLHVDSSHAAWDNVPAGPVAFLPYIPHLSDTDGRTMEFTIIYNIDFYHPKR